MRLRRVYCTAPLQSGHALELDGPAVEHLVRVLRVRVGAALRLFDGGGGEFEAEVLAVARARLRVAVGRHLEIERESALSLTLLQGVARGERMDLIVQKATELGVTAIVPLETERSVVRLDAATRERRRAHWNAIAASACEQCGRNRLPQICAPCTLAAGLERVAAVPGRWLLDPLAPRSLRAAAAATAAGVAVLIGPEGGLSTAEREVALRAGFVGCALGPRILRTETAAIVALAAIQAMLGDLGREGTPPDVGEAPTACEARGC